MNVDELPIEVLIVLAVLGWVAYGIVRWYERSGEHQASTGLGQRGRRPGRSTAHRSDRRRDRDRLDPERAGRIGGVPELHDPDGLRPERTDRPEHHSGRGRRLHRGADRSSGVLPQGLIQPCPHLSALDRRDGLTCPQLGCMPPGVPSITERLDRWEELR